MSGFRNLIAELWNALDLGTPAFAADGSVVLETDAGNITLSPDIGGRQLTLSAKVGALAADAAVQAAQVRQVLMSNLRHLPLSTALVTTRKAEDGTFFIEIQKNIEQSNTGIYQVISSIEDIIIHHKNIYTLLNPHKNQTHGKSYGNHGADKIDFIFRS